MTLTTTKRAIVSTNDLEEIRELQSRVAEKLKSVGLLNLAGQADELVTAIEIVAAWTWDNRDAGQVFDLTETVQ